MVYIRIVCENEGIVLHCYKGSEDGEYFKLVIDSKTKEIIERPEGPDIDASAAYSHVYNLLCSGEPLPKKTVAAWG